MKNIILFTPRLAVVLVITAICFVYWLGKNCWNLFWFNETGEQPFGWNEFCVDMWGWLFMGRFFIDFEHGRFCRYGSPE